MTKIDIFSGFLGAGKTTLIKKLIREAYKNEKLVLIENEFGSIGIDGEFLKESEIVVNELNSGCICCSLVGDFSSALEKVILEYSPDRVIIEPSGVGKLSDVVTAVENTDNKDISINGLTTIVDANKCKMYMKNFGEFFNNQIENAKCIILSHTDNINNEKFDDVLKMIKEKNDKASIITTSWDKLSGSNILDSIEQKHTIDDEINDMKIHHHHHHHEECECGHHHHHHDEECECGHHHHHHHHEECECGHHHHNHADDVFTSWGIETVKKYTQNNLKEILTKIQDKEKYGFILRAKGVVETPDGEWLHFDYVPGEIDIRIGTATVCGRICVIGSEMKEDKISELFN